MAAVGPLTCGGVDHVCEAHWHCLQVLLLTRGLAAVHRDDPASREKRCVGDDEDGPARDLLERS